MLVGPGVFLLLAAVVVIFDPLMATGGQEPPPPAPRGRRRGRGLQERALPGVPAQRARPEPTYGQSADEAVSGPSGGGSRGVHDW